MGKVNVSPEAWVMSGAVVVGDVTVGPETSIWHNAVLRGDEMEITVGARTNIQDGCVLHGDYNVSVGDEVTVGHLCIIHGCTIGDRCIIGMGSVVLNGAKIGSDCIIGAGSLVTEGTEIPSGHLAFGRPAKVVRPLNEKDREMVSSSYKEYIRLARKAEGQDETDEEP